MSNKVTLATIQFRADAKGVNPALDSIRQASKDAHNEVERLQAALNRGIKTMKDVNGVDFDVTKKIAQLTKEAKSFDAAIRELTKGATALEAVWKNIEMGTIEKNSRAELKGAINAAQSRLRSIRAMQENGTVDAESLQRQRELNVLITEAQKQLNNLDRDTSKFIETLEKGEAVSQSMIDKETKGLKEMLSLIPSGTEEWNKYNEQLTKIQQHIAEIRKQEREAATSLLSSKDMGQYSEEQIRTAITNGKELLATYKTNSDEAKVLADNIVRAEQFLKQYGVEAARQAQREQEQLRLEQELAKTMRKRLTDLKSLSVDALSETRRYWEAQRNEAAEGTKEFQKAEQAIKKINNLQKKRKVAELDTILGAPSKFGVAEVKNAVQEMEKLRDSVQYGIPAWQHYNKMVKEGKAYLDQLAKSEAAQRINDQMTRLTSLSESGLQEVKKYWETMVAGAERGSQELLNYQNKLAQVVAEEQSRANLSARATSNRLQSTDLGQYSEKEIRDAIEAGKQLIQTYNTADPAAKALAENIVRAEEHLKQYGVEAERAARREAEALAEAARKRQEADALMQQQLQQGTALSQSALRQQEQYWQRLIDDPKTAAASLDQYKQNLEQVRQLQTSMALGQSREQADKVLGRDFALMSEGELRAAITAAREYQKTLKTTDNTYKELSKAILDAEEWVKKYGIEAERSARKEAQAVAEAARKREEANRTMEEQLRRGIGLTQSALKAQENYWQRMADDPKAAASELERYIENLNKVRAIQKEQEESMVKEKGLSALNRFRGDMDYENKVSDKQLKEDVAALKAYRDSLPKEGNLSLIREIDYYIGLTGKSAKDATKAVMSLSDAEALAGKLGTSGFTASTDKLKLAKKALEEAQSAAGRGSARFTELQAAINKVDLELKRTGEITAEVQSVLDNPKGRSFNQLKQAVEQGRVALNAMDRSTLEGQKAFDELAEKIKACDQEMKELGNSARGTASSFDKAWSRLKTYVGLYVGAAVAMQKVSQTMGDLMELSDKMGEVRKTTGFTADEVGRLTTELKEMDTRTSITGLLDLSVAAGQLGLKTQEDVEGFTEAANKLMVALPEMGKEGATEMLKVALATGEIDKIRKQMEQGMIEGSSATAVAMEKVGSTIDRLRASSAATAPAITDFVKRVGAVGAQSGITIDQVAALGSTVDALGMRVEMSATALSRMMPAIRNNAFDLAKILHVEPNTIRELYDTGRGMEVILMVLQHIKDAGMDADSIESMLGKGGMQEVMKELNQQGARAGIVFGGLSQNVDELRRQLGVAKQAYEENIAIQQEYDKMNETTAAKWERLKNQIEETFVGDSAQRSLGVLIDALRKLVDVITGNLGPALNWISVLIKTFITYWAVLKVGLGEGIFVKAAGGLKAMGSGLTHLISNTKQYITYSTALRKAQTEQAKAAIKAEMAQKGLNKAMIANVWTALVVAVGALVYMMYNYINSLKEAGREAAKFQAELDKEQRKVKELTNSIGEARVKVEDANKEVEKARKALDAAKKSTDETTESSKRLAKAEADLLAAEEKKKNAMAEHKRMIEEFNTQYSKYLGFMLSEVSSNLELARARDLVNDKLRETITLKRQEAAIERVEKDKGEKRDKEYGDLYDYVGKFTEVRGGDTTKRPRVMAAITKAANSAKDRKDFERQVQAIFKSNKINYPQMLLNQALDYYDEVSNVRLATNQVVSQFAGEQQANRQMSQAGLVRQTNAGFANYNKLLSNFKNSKGDERARNAAAVLQQMDTMAEIRDNASSYYDMNNPAEAALYKKQFKQLSEWKGYDRNALLKVAGKYYTPRKTMTDSGGTGVSGSFTTGNVYTSGGGGTGGWGNEVDAASTDYSTWDVTELVERRKQMNKFKNVLKPGIDVRRVLAEDKALMKAIDEGKVGTDWQSVLNWYNTERKKIQEELKSERFSTNEGNWRDEKTKKGRKKRGNPFKESDYALAELDRYYSKRKEYLEKAREEENMSEELYNREVELLEQEHLKKRSDLRRTFTADNSKEEQAMVKQFRKWWSALEKSGDLDVVPWATVESEWSKATAAQIGRNNLKAQQDLTQLQSITVKHLNAIAKLIDKERPYDGITANLRDNLTKMDILFADIQKNGPSQDTLALVKAGTERLKFLLGEAETAYSSTIEDVLRRMGEAGMTAWAEEIRKSPDMQNALMAQLQKAYDAVQDAIKKESDQIKRQTDIWWADVEKGQTQSRKGGFERMLSSLGLAEDQVRRANSLIGAGHASQRVVDKLAIKQMQVQLQMQETYYLRMRQIGEERIRQLEAQGKMEDAEHLRRSLNLALTKEQSELDKQRVAIANQLEESQNRLYTELKEWSDLLAQSLQSVFEASNAGNAEYYNELAKLKLTGKGGPGAGTYVVIDNEGTSDAKAHYEYLDERQALERQHEIEQENAKAEAWKKVMDDLNKKMSDMITDRLNALLQNAVIEANTTAVSLETEALRLNTEATNGLSNQLAQGIMVNNSSNTEGGGTPGVGDFAADKAANYSSDNMSTSVTETAKAEQDASDNATKTIVENNKKAEKSTKSSFAAMTAAANMYGIAYQAMSNENLSTTQKVEMMIVQAAGQALISMLTASLAADTAETASHAPSWVSKTLASLGPIGGPVAVGVFTALIGGLMGLATSKITKSKSQIAQATGASGASAGRLTTGMLTYAEGNVNEFTDPASLTPGRQYNVDAADGRTYRARYMGSNPKTHITNGPEFHLSGERGREMIIDAGTTRQITMNESEIWHAIKTLSGGGRITAKRRHGHGVLAFADGNADEFDDVTGSEGMGVGMGTSGISTDMVSALKDSIDHQNELLEYLRDNPIRALNKWDGPDGIPNMVNQYNKKAARHGENYL